MSAVSMVTLKGQDEKVALGTLTILQKLYLSSILHLTHHTPLSRSRFGRMRWGLRHREVEESVGATDFSAPLCRDIFLPCSCRVAACGLCRLRVGRIYSILH